jgi:hypothetical protein
VIEPADIEDLLQSGFTRMVGPWCEENNVEQQSLLWVVLTLGADPNPPAIVVISAFQCGYEACKRNMPGEGMGPHEKTEPSEEEGRHVVQHVVVDTESSEIIAGPNPHIDFVEDVATRLNAP